MSMELLVIIPIITGVGTGIGIWKVIETTSKNISANRFLHIKKQFEMTYSELEIEVKKELSQIYDMKYNEIISDMRYKSSLETSNEFTKFVERKLTINGYDSENIQIEIRLLSLEISEKRKEFDRMEDKIRESRIKELENKLKRLLERKEQLDEEFRKILRISNIEDLTKQERKEIIFRVRKKIREERRNKHQQLNNDYSKKLEIVNEKLVKMKMNFETSNSRISIK